MILTLTSTLDYLRRGNPSTLRYGLIVQPAVPLVTLQHTARILAAHTHCCLVSQRRDGLDFGDTRLSRVCLVTAFGHAHPISLNRSSPSHSPLAAHLKSHRIALRFNSPLTHLHHSALPVRDYLASSELIFPMHPEISTREPSPRSVTWMAYYARHSEPTRKKLPHSASCWAIVNRYSVVLQCIV